MKENKNLGGSAISAELLIWMKSNIKEGTTILELGSGTGTIELCKTFNMYSVEHDSKWIGKSNSNYIHATLIDGWYDTDAISTGIKGVKYEVILIDGPIGSEPRMGFLNNIELFNIDNKIIIIDDLQREYEMKMLLEMSELYGREYEIHTHEEKSFGVLK